MTEDRKLPINWTVVATHVTGMAVAGGLCGACVAAGGRLGVVGALVTGTVVWVLGVRLWREA